MTSGLMKLSPITVAGKSLPPAHLFQNIPTLHRILEEVLQDWLRAVEPYQREIDGADGEMSMRAATSTGFVELQPLLLKCLFPMPSFSLRQTMPMGIFTKN